MSEKIVGGELPPPVPAHRSTIQDQPLPPTPKDQSPAEEQLPEFPANKEPIFDRESRVSRSSSSSEEGPDFVDNKEPVREPIREPSPEPIKEASPEPFHKEPSPEPFHKEPSPEPFYREASPILEKKTEISNTPLLTTSDILHNINQLSDDDLEEPDNDLMEEMDNNPDSIYDNKVPRDILTEVQEFTPENLNPVTTKEPLEASDYIQHDQLVKDIGNFDTDNLKETNTKEENYLPTSKDIRDELSEVSKQVEKSKEMFGNVLENVENFDKDDLKDVGNPQDTFLPDKIDFLAEKSRENVLNELESPHNLAHVETKEVKVEELLHNEYTRSNTIESVAAFDKSSLRPSETLEKNLLPSNSDLIEEKKVERLMDSLEKFDNSDLKPVETEEKGVLPDVNDIQDERLHRELLVGIESFDPEEQSKVSTREPVSAVDLAKQEMARTDLLKNVENFDKTQMSHTEPEEKIVLPSSEDVIQEKTHEQLLSGIEHFNPESLKESETREPVSATDLMAQELFRSDVLSSVESYDKTRMTHTEPEEKIILPSSEDVIQEKTHEQLLSGIEHFNPESLKESETREPVSATDLMAQELLRSDVLSSVESYDKTQMTHTEPEEKIVLPSSEDVIQEKTHEQLLSGIEHFNPESLKESETREPVSATDLMAQELLRSDILTSVGDYDKSRLTPTKMIEKIVLPSSEDLIQEKTHQNLLTGIESFNPTDLKESGFQEPLTATELAKHELLLENLKADVTSYDKSGLTPTTVEEKVVLPDAKTIQAEKLLQAEKQKEIGETSSSEEGLLDDNSSPRAQQETRTSSDEWIKVEEPPKNEN